MDAIVSARVPIALKERGNGILHDIGSTPTQLINAAYQFVLAEHELPKPHDPLEGMRGAKRELTDEQALELSQRLAGLERREMASIVHYDGEAYVRRAAWSATSTLPAAPSPSSAPASLSTTSGRSTPRSEVLLRSSEGRDASFSPAPAAACAGRRSLPADAPRGRPSPSRRDPRRRA